MQPYMVQVAYAFPIFLRRSICYLGVHTSFFVNQPIYVSTYTCIGTFGWVFWSTKPYHLRSLCPWTNSLILLSTFFKQKEENLPSHCFFFIFGGENINFSNPTQVACICLLQSIYKTDQIRIKSKVAYRVTGNESSTRLSLKSQKKKRPIPLSLGDVHSLTAKRQSTKKMNANIQSQALLHIIFFT